jgi:hypothetical protein
VHNAIIGDDRSRCSEPKQPNPEGVLALVSALSYL